MAYHRTSRMMREMADRVPLKADEEYGRLSNRNKMIRCAHTDRRPTLLLIRDRSFVSSAELGHFRQRSSFLGFGISGSRGERPSRFLKFPDPETGLDLNGDI